ncbi:MBL fold metallo-hydrolase [Burkholderia singularis]|uniref:MBL fold metallo-hydrolase n=1 Tax=Burkholderia singularis TaxID=1503053 RepID=A0A118DLU3_9BURK|nr:MBL fold metallo-hydrolase [Burkholderia singularis]KVE23814.1 MBL fold metallo-hydrolase [Burkholderia singularis]
MSTSSIVEIRPGLYRASTYVEKLKLAFSQFFVKALDGGVLCVETGTRGDFPGLVESLAGIGVAPAQIGDVVVPHFEVDEMGALPDFAAANPKLTAHGHPICTHALADIFGVRAKPLKDGECVTLSGTEVVPVYVKHVHQWDALVVYLPRYKALLSSDLFMRFGPVAATGDDPVDGIVASIERAGYLPSMQYFAAALRKLQALDIEIVLPMHGPAIERDVPDVVARLLAYCERSAAA